MDGSPTSTAFSEPRPLFHLISAGSWTLMAFGFRSAAARAGQRDKSRRTEKLLDLRYFLLAADEASHLLRQVVRRRVKRAQRRKRLRQIGLTEKPGEYRFSLPDAWSVSLFTALLRRYDLRPYRYRGQRRTTVMTKVTKSFVDETLWPEFQQLSATLRHYLDDVTRRVIAEAIHGDVTDAEERTARTGTADGGEGAAQQALGLDR